MLKLDPDAKAWIEIPFEDKWVFDKLILSSFLGYKCGPAGVPVPEEGEYIVRPIVNIGGMSAKAEIRYLTLEDSVTLPPGYFWCEIFKGTHLSIDVVDGKLSYGAVGHKREDGITFDRWEILDANQVKAILPQMFQVQKIGKMLKYSHKYVNFEMIGGNVIEVHLRKNPNPIDQYKELKVVWQGDDIDMKKYKSEGWEWIPAEDDGLGHLEVKRLGFLAR